MPGVELGPKRSIFRIYGKYPSKNVPSSFGSSQHLSRVMGPQSGPLGVLKMSVQRTKTSDSRGVPESEIPDFLC